MDYKIISIEKPPALKLISLNSKNFKLETSDSKPVAVLVWFGDKSNRANLALLEFERLASKFPSTKFAELNAVVNPIKGFTDFNATPPFLALFIKGKEVKRMAGYASSTTLLRWLSVEPAASTQGIVL